MSDESNGTPTKGKENTTGADPVPCLSLLDDLVNKFLCWPLPDSVAADPCACHQGSKGRIGTNLLTATEARQMLLHLLSRAFDERRNFATEAEGDAYMHGYFDGITKVV